MIIQFKIFESSQFNRIDPSGEFKHGDYILIDTSKISYRDLHLKKRPKKYLTAIWDFYKNGGYDYPHSGGYDYPHSGGYDYPHSGGYDYPHSVIIEFKNRVSYIGVEKKEIVRKLTPKEIDEIDIKKQIDKYNL